MTELFFSIIVLLFAYLIGAIPTGYTLSRVAGIADIRKHGSGNIGATNVARFLGIKYFFIVFLLDAIKAFVFLFLISGQVTDYLFISSAVMLLIGNAYSIFLGFSGGKGVATAVGIISATAPYLVPLVFIPWAVLLWATRIMGVASVGAILCLPVISVFLHVAPTVFFLNLFIAVWVTFRHVRNLQEALFFVRMFGRK